MDDLARIHTYIKVVQSGSFSAAARLLNTSVTSVARQVNSLEDDFKVRLIHRTSRRLALTEPGKLFYERACSISAQFQSAVQETTSFQESVRGVLRVSLRPSVGNLIIVPALPRFLERHPGLKVHISLPEERRDLIANDIDVAVWMGDIPAADIVARRLSSGQRVVCASPEYLKTHGVPERPEDLRHHNCMLFEAPSYPNRWVFTKGEERHEIEVEGSIASDNGMTIYGLGLAGAGCIIAHEWAARVLIAQGRLVRVLGDYTATYSATAGDLYAVYPSNRGLSRKVRAFVDFLVELLDENAVRPSWDIPPALETWAEPRIARPNGGS